jgi:uncharacterized protein YlaI
MISIQKDKIIFTRDIWEELRNNPIYTELIEDIEDRMELENAIKEQKKSNEDFIDFEVHDKERMDRIKSSK